MSNLLLLGCGGPFAAAGWNPGSEGSLVSWFDMTTPASFDSGAKTWTARYGSKVATSPSTGPTKVTTAFGGAQNGLVFTGNSNTCLQIPSPNVQETVSALVLKFTTVATGVNPIIWTRGALGFGVAGMITYDFGGIGLRYLQGAGDANDYGATVSTGGIVVARNAKAARTIRWNGTESATETTATTGTEPGLNDTFNVFDYTGSAVNYVVEVAAVGVFQGSGWSTALAQKIEGFIAHQGIGGMSTATLPVGHPYKSTAP